MWIVRFDEKGATVEWEGGSFHRPGATTLENPEQYVPKEHLDGPKEIGTYRYHTHKGSPPAAEDGFFPTEDPRVMLRPVKKCKGREERSVRVSCCMRDSLYCTILDKEIVLNDCYKCDSAVANDTN